ncbi:hypothetical protein NOK12_16530 [Nocardioides sp. OK12]|uniref:hypothetical protein n=1 Tax=Nocardioides sp. OK12 TaxID=2758661 RepID=UPI0021C3A7A5|nr:hypothetical protein [Nocardioides sp. OK12]GHJ59135.1 hypothetical protein NOK12_16530 [Nocardioides sp. OK12]
MRVRVHNHLDDLTADLHKIPANMVRNGSAVVQRSTREGNALARSIARSKSGKHGKNAYKRLTAEMIDPLTGEYGWTGDASRIVGAGWRSGPPNTDLEKSLDVVGPKFAKAAGDMLSDLFWPGA